MNVTVVTQQPSSGTSGRVQSGAQGEFAPVRVSSQVFTCGGSKLTSPSRR